MSDAEMEDRPEKEEEEEEEGEEEEEDLPLLPPDPRESEPKMKIISSAKKGCATYEVRSEGHTMGNAIRWSLNKNAKVGFAGYTIPHPSEDCIHLRVQTQNPDEVESGEVMKESFEILENVFDHIMTEFIAQVEAA
eukprot:CAMPEP_0201520586 /NCGR_PEP_ID=MMETSP0161_2-20130828/11970_1 /ASSEMBLY_ACC=CAM_ASM_000251 /TAXON_ID=180227 /ORGANISM="Neoparamoeba aestuarina, Strain SoJaBio B1-5/56/2" /LENGTH=135 /DNA_ID=CAMNT_0047919011 /DNA_START=16 /DNA_END=419 /DNA_ORIENTATION=+